MRLAKRACRTPGCFNTASRGARCDACQRAQQAAQDKQRKSPVGRGYDEQHRRLRVLAFQRDGWRCVDCAWRPSIVRDFEQYELGEPLLAEVLEELRKAKNAGEQHLHGDHIVPIEERPDLRLDLDNYATRCNKCHNAKTMRELQASRGGGG